MRPELETQENLKWSVRLCLTVPPAAPPLLPIGQPGEIYDFQFDEIFFSNKIRINFCNFLISRFVLGLLRVNKKMLMFFHLTRTNTAILPQGTEPLSVVIPIGKFYFIL